MKQYIDKYAVVAEIERIRNKEVQWMNRQGYTDYHMGLRDGYADILSFLNTLDVKEVENFIWNNARTTVHEDSTKQIICIKEDGLAVSTIGKIVNGTVKWAYLDDLLNTNSFNVKMREVDLEKEVTTYMYNEMRFLPDEVEYDTLLTIVRHFFELGLKTKGGIMIELKGKVDERFEKEREKAEKSPKTDVTENVEIVRQIVSETLKEG